MMYFEEKKAPNKVVRKRWLTLLSCPGKNKLNNIWKDHYLCLEGRYRTENYPVSQKATCAWTRVRFMAGWLLSPWWENRGIPVVPEPYAGGFVPGLNWWRSTNWNGVVDLPAGTLSVHIVINTWTCRRMVHWLVNVEPIWPLLAVARGQLNIQSVVILTLPLLKGDTQDRLVQSPRIIERI